MEDYSSQPVRTSIRGAIAKIAKEESGDTTAIDYVSHPLDKATMPEDATVQPAAVTKKRKSTGSAASTRAKTQNKPVMPRNKATPTPRKRSTGNATPTARSRTTAKKEVQDHPVASNLVTPQKEDSLTRLDGQETQQLVDPQNLVGKTDASLDNADSELSELEQTPERPNFVDRSFENRPVEDVKDEQQPNTIIEQPGKETPQIARRIAISPLLTNSVDSVHSQTIPIGSGNDRTTPAANGSVVSAEQSQSTPPTHLASLDAGSALTPTTPRSVRQSHRSRVQPIRFGELIPTPAVAEEQAISTSVDRKPASANDSPIAQKVFRNAKAAEGTKSARRKLPVSPEKLSTDDLANEVPITIKLSRKRKAASTAAEATPRKRTTKVKTDTETPSATKAPRKTPIARRKKEAVETPVLKIETTQSLPTPPQSQSDYLEATGQYFDPDLLKLSRALTHREPLDSKPEPRGKPEVWAPGRQELCETVPYYKSPHSGCYSNQNNVYAFMFDSAGMGREYMDQDVIIARMGGGMDTDSKTGLIAQAKDHDIDGMQPRSLLNNIMHRNPLVIICGNKNSGAPTLMPHRYCVLDWFKPTHVWAELTMGKKGPTPTIRYRFERLDISKPSWYASASGSTPKAPTDLILPSHTCQECLEACPQIYLVGWVCTNPKCVALWKFSNGQHAPYGELDYHPAFLLHRTKWEREDPPFSVNPGIPEFGQHIGDNLTYINTRGVVCPRCGRCNPRYKFTHWRCDTAGCDWKLTPDHRVVAAQNLTHHPWDMISDGPTLVKAQTAPVVRTQVRYRSNYKLLRYTIDGVAGSIIVAKANKKVNSEPGGPDDMFRDIQLNDLGLERRMMRVIADGESKPAVQLQISPTEPTGDASNTINDEQEQLLKESDQADEEPEDDHKAEVGNRMTAFGMNYGMPYKFIASGDSRSFEDAPAAIRAAWSRLNFAQREFVNEPAGYQDFNEELVFAYMQGQNIKYHDDGERGLGPRIATLSLGAGATMSLRVKAKYYSQVSKTGVFTYEKPLPLPVLESSHQGFKPKTKGADALKEGYAARVAGFEELKKLKDAGNTAEFRKRSKELATKLKLRRVQAQPLLSFHLTHGDIVIMEGEDIQKFLEHQVDPCGNLRFALTCRTILENHLTPDQLPQYNVGEAEVYDGSGIREEGDNEPLVWD